MSMLTDFSNGLSASPLPALVTGHDWLVPAIQVVHILSVAAVAIAALHINLRVLGLMERDAPLREVGARFLPILWKAVAVLAFTGFLLIASEPNRAMFRFVFWVKMAMVLAASIATGVQRPQDPATVSGKNSQALGVVAVRYKALAVFALILWALAIFAGRWIAYADP